MPFLIYANKASNFFAKIVSIELLNGIAPHTDSGQSQHVVCHSMGQSANHLSVVAPGPTGKVL